MALSNQEKTCYTAEEYLSWGEDVRAEIIDGKLFMMAPPTLTHQGVLVALASQLYDFLKGKPCKVFPAPVGVRLVETEDTVLEPDIIVVCDPEKLSGQKICNGAPDLVVEILSPSTAKMDTLIKFQKYQKSGVPEYWILDPESKTLHVNLLHDGAYKVQVYTQTDNVPVQVLEGCRVNLQEVFAE